MPNIMNINLLKNVPIVEVSDALFNKIQNKIEYNQANKMPQKITRQITLAFLLLVAINCFVCTTINERTSENSFATSFYLNNNINLYANE
jgi:phage-related holin